MCERKIQGSACAVATCRLWVFLMMSPAQDDRSGRFEPGRNEERPYLFVSDDRRKPRMEYKLLL